MNGQKISIHCLLTFAVLIALVGLWQPVAAKSRIYRLQAGETIGLGMQGLHATNIPRGVTQVYLDAVGTSVPARFSLKTDLRFRLPALEVRFLDAKGGEVESISALVYVYFAIGKAELDQWQKGGMDEIAIWYAGGKGSKWVRCPTYFVDERGIAGTVGRLACLAPGSGFYALEREIAELSHPASPTPAPYPAPAEPVCCDPPPLEPYPAPGGNPNATPIWPDTFWPTSEGGADPNLGGNPPETLIWPDWESPGFLYIKAGSPIMYEGSGEPILTFDAGYLIFSNLAGTHKSTLPDRNMFGFGPWGLNLSPETGLIVNDMAYYLWVIDDGGEGHRILALDQPIESPVITSNGSKIAYSLAYGLGGEDIQQLWTINPNGTEKIRVIDDTGRYITDPGPFRLRPIAWSSDNTKVYLITTSESLATSAGMYVADLATGTIKKALTPQVILWDVSFSPDRTKIAYRTFQRKSVSGDRPQAGPPFTLNVTDLTSGETKILLESETDQYFHPIWSTDGNRLAYSVRPGEWEADMGVFTIDLATGVETLVIPGSESSRLTAWCWLPQDKLAYTEGDLSSEAMFVNAEGYPSSGKMWNFDATLYTINIDGTTKHTIDSGGIVVLGVIDK